MRSSAESIAYLPAVGTPPLAWPPRLGTEDETAEVAKGFAERKYSDDWAG